MRDHIARSYSLREWHAARVRQYPAPFLYACPTCRGKGTLPRYNPARKEPCDACDGTGQQRAHVLAALPAAPRPIYVHDVSVVSGRGHYSESERWSTEEPTPRRAWEASERDTPRIYDTGETWQAIVWRLPARRGYLAGVYMSLSESYVWDTHRTPWEEAGDRGGDFDDAQREARAMADRLCREECEGMEAREYAREEGGKAGEAGKLASDNPYTPRLDGHGEEEEWEIARADAYADAAREAGEADGESGAPIDPDVWPADRLAYLEGHARGYAALTHAARRAGLVSAVTP